MQLAMSQRPHPPPVPPRPSRQVVAEALKRSSRPPCPTRQAPPPPNIKPWRCPDQQNIRERGGRTVIYESVKDSINMVEGRSSSEPRAIYEFEKQDEIVRSRESKGDAIGRGGTSGNIDVCKTGPLAERRQEHSSCLNRATSERYKAESNRERHSEPQPKLQQPQLCSHDNELCDRKNSTPRSSENAGEILSQKNERTIMPNDEKSVVFNDEKSPVCNDNERNSAESFLYDGKTDNLMIGSKPNSTENDLLTFQCDTRMIKDDEIAKKVDRLNDVQVDDGSSERIPKIEGNDKSMENDKDYYRPATENNMTLFANSDRDDKDEPNETKASTTPTEISEKRSCIKDNDIDTWDTKEEPVKRFNAEDSIGAGHDSAKTISSDDCATVVVIDESECKISINNEDNDNIHHQDWLEEGVRYSSTKITLAGDDAIDECRKIGIIDDKQCAYPCIDFHSIRERIAMSSIQGLPPLPRSLSGFNLNEGRREAVDPPPPPTRSSSKTPKNVKSAQPSTSRASPPDRQFTTLDNQLSVLRKEMFGLRQLDLLLLSQLWSLNESIQEFRQLLQDQEDRAPSPSPSSEEGDDISYRSHPPPPPRRPAPQLHHHRPPRPPRPLRPPTSDESPSSE